jgi:integrase
MASQSAQEHLDHQGHLITPTLAFSDFHALRLTSLGTRRRGAVARLKRIFDEAKDYLAKPKKANTLERYGRIWKSINESGLNIIEYLDYVASTTPGQFVITKAAAIHGLWKLIMQKFRSAVRKTTAGLKQASTDELNEVVGVRMVIEMLRDKKPPKDAFTRKGCSKRATLKKLPQDWRKRLAANTITAALPAVLVSMLSGCRPEELAMGIKVSVLDDRHLLITIDGAKVTEHNGQPWRKLTYDVSLSDEAAQLWRITSRKGGNMVVKREPRTFHKNLESACEKAGLPGISAYTCRHYFASQLKSAFGTAKEIIAMALGHASTATQQVYGTKQQGRKGGLALVDVSAARAVRTPDRPHPGLSTSEGVPTSHPEEDLFSELSDPSPFR